MAANLEFPDFDWFVGTYIPAQKIDHLKQYLEAISQETGKWITLRTGSRKADYVDRVQQSFKDIRRLNQGEKYRNLKEKCEMIGKKPYGASTTYLPPPTFGGVPAAGPSRTNWANGATSVALPQRAGGYLEDWKPSPMWKPLRALTAMTMLPDINANESNARKERKVHFQLQQDVIEKLQQTKSNPSILPQYSVRLFCTSNDHYRPQGAYTSSTAHITNKRIPIEYPTTPDFVVDDYHLRYTERGLRGKPGSAPPVDLHRTSRGMSLVPGTLRSVCFGHTGPTTGKKKDVAKRFFFQVVFCEWTPKDELLKRLETLPPTAPAQSLALREYDMTALIEVKKDEDDDIVHGVSKMTLKDKLSYMRIKTPVRSKQCAHLQCFEAKWWIEANSVHPQWLCPLCDKELAFEDIFVDGFFLSILNAVPEEVEEVVMEGDGGEWHTEDKKFGSSKWMAENGAPVPVAKKEPSPVKESPNKGKRKAIEILSSDDEDEEAPLSRNASTNLSVPPFNRPGSSTSSVTNALASVSGTARPSSTRSNEVIDLTLDSDDDEPNPPRTPDFQTPGTGHISRPAPPAGAGGSYLQPPPRQNEANKVESAARAGATAFNQAVRWNHLHPALDRLDRPSSTTYGLADRYVPSKTLSGRISPYDGGSSRSSNTPLSERIGLDRAVDKDAERRQLGSYSHKRPRVDDDLDLDAGWEDWFEKTRGEEDRGWRTDYRA